MSASLLINQDNGKLYTNLYDNPLGLSPYATVSIDPATITKLINHSQNEVLPLEATTFVSNSNTISMAVDNIITINKTGRYRLKGIVQVGISSPAPPQDSEDLAVAGGVAVVPNSTCVAIFFAKVPPAPAPIAQVGAKKCVYVNLNVVQQLTVDVVVPLVAGDEISLFGASLSTDVMLRGVNNPNFVCPAISVEISEI